MRTVQFSELIEVFEYEDYPEYRKAYWEIEARDRVRFVKRVLEIAEKIEYIFNPVHRSKFIKDIEKKASN